MILIYRGIRGYMQRRAATRMAAAAVAPTSIAGRERPVDPDAAISTASLLPFASANGDNTCRQL